MSQVEIWKEFWSVGWSCQIFSTPLNRCSDFWSSLGWFCTTIPSVTLWWIAFFRPYNATKSWELDGAVDSTSPVKRHEPDSAPKSTRHHSWNNENTQSRRNSTARDRGTHSKTDDRPAFEGTLLIFSRFEEVGLKVGFCCHLLPNNWHCIFRAVLLCTWTQPRLPVSFWADKFFMFCMFKNCAKSPFKPLRSKS